MTKLEKYHCKLNREKVQEALNTTYPSELFSGRGIVTSGGSEKYFIPAVIMIRILRDLGCTLPIQLWYLGDREMTPEMKEIASDLENVELVDAYEMMKTYPMAKMGGWESKVYSIMYSRFKEVLFIDSDNIPVRDPSDLFESPLYKETGALFWPDLSSLTRSRKIWKICDVPYVKEPEFESGQMVIDKSRNWSPLLVTKHLNEQSDFYYQSKGKKTNGYIWGDKDTFHMAWHMTRYFYSMIPRRVKRIPYTMLQHDENDRVLFQHRNFAKFTLRKKNPRVSGFLHEDRCLEYLEDLRKKWKFDKGYIPMVYEDVDLDRVYKQLTTQKYFKYHRLGKDSRVIELTPDQQIKRGRTSQESSWDLLKEGVGVKLLFRDESGQTASSLKYQYRDSWIGDSHKGMGRVRLQACKGS